MRAHFEPETAAPEHGTRRQAGRCDGAHAVGDGTYIESRRSMPPARPNALATMLAHSLADTERRLTDEQERARLLARTLVAGLHALDLGHEVLLRLELPPAARAVVLQQARRIGWLLQSADCLGPMSGERPRRAPAGATARAYAPLAPGRRVLVVDDDSAERLATRLLLELHGCDVRVASDRATALASVAAETPSIVLTAWHLGSGETAGDVLAAIRARCGREVPAVVVAGDPAPPDVPAGCVLLEKPFPANALLDALARADDSGVSAGCPAL